MSNTLFALLGLYLATGLLATLLQRTLIYPAPTPRRPHGPLVEFSTPTGRTVFAVHLPPSRPAAPTIVYFHGNAEQLADAERFAGQLHALGVGVLAVEYPGYGPAASQSISEAAIVANGIAAVAWLRRQHGVSRAQTILLGQSLGTGVATALAAKKLAARLILLSPYTSIVDLAQRVLPIFPMRWLVWDRFDNATKAPSVDIPTLIIHGKRDRTVPFEMGRRLSHLFPKGRLIAIESAGHNDLISHDPTAILQHIRRFVLAK